MWREIARMAYLWRVPHGLDGRRLRASLVALGHAHAVPAVAAPAR